MSEKIKVLIVDDSPIMRQMISHILSQDPEVEVLGTAQDAIVAREKIKSLNPDVITMDVEMPGMDGVSFLEKIMTLRPMPVVMVSTLTGKNTETTLKAMEIGAVECVGKPNATLEGDISDFSEEIVRKVKAAFKARTKITSRNKNIKVSVLKPDYAYNPKAKIVAIGSSTGGVEALRDIIVTLPSESPAIIITQHMPEGFTASFAARLDKISQVRVKEAESKDMVVPGYVYIAPGNRHMKIEKSTSGLILTLHDSEKVSGHKPSVDVMFDSVANALGKKAIGVILTGMGKDGAQGLLKMRQAGAETIGQDEKTCIVYGMPKAAMQLGAVGIELPLSKISTQILRYCQ